MNQYEFNLVICVHQEETVHNICSVYFQVKSVILRLEFLFKFWVENSLFLYC